MAHPLSTDAVLNRLFREHGKWSIFWGDPQHITLNLNGGVNVNYGKLDDLLIELKAVTGVIE